MEASLYSWRVREREGGREGEREGGREGNMKEGGKEEKKADSLSVSLSDFVLPYIFMLCIVDSLRSRVDELVSIYSNSSPLLYIEHLQCQAGSLRIPPSAISSRTCSTAGKGRWICRDKRGGSTRPAG